MKTKLQIKSIFGSVLFEFESEDNSIKRTLEEAIKNTADLTSADLTSADLTSADLRYANLTSADLTSADLTSADLRYTNLRYANLTSADLTSANLRYADLRYANLRYANLTSADLRYANLTSADLRCANLTSADLRYANIPLFCKWSHSIVDGNKIQIGCKVKTIEAWEKFFNSDQEYYTSRSSTDFKQIQAIFESYKAYINFLSK